MTRDDLDENVRDHLTALAKSALGAVPFAGSFLAELAGTVIPEQRVDRLVRFAKALDERLAGLNQEFLKSQMANENFTDLGEEAMRQAARSLSEERRAYIANLIANGIQSEEIEYVESKHLLRLLGELNDIEVLWLRFFVDPLIDGDNDFRETNADVFELETPYIGGPQAAVDKAALQNSYHEHLQQLGLIQPHYKLDSKTKQPIFDSRTGALQVARYEITALGRVLLRQVGLWDDGA